MNDFEGLAFYDVSSSLGDIRLYLPAEFDKDTLQLRDGELFNVSNSTVYLFCPDYPEYTFSASRWNTVTYRTSGAQYQTADLGRVTVSDTYSPIGWANALFLFCCLICAISALLRGVRHG